MDPRVDDPVVPNALAAVDAALLPPVVRLGLVGDHLADPIGHEREVGRDLVREEVGRVQVDMVRRRARDLGAQGDGAAGRSRARQQLGFPNAQPRA